MTEKILGFGDSSRLPKEGNVWTSDTDIGCPLNVLGEGYEYTNYKCAKVRQLVDQNLNPIKDSYLCTAAYKEGTHGSTYCEKAMKCLEDNKSTFVINWDDLNELNEK